MDSSSTVSVAAAASTAAEPAVETCQLGNSETNSTTVASATSITAPKQQRGNKNRNNHKKNDTPNNESNPSSSSKQGNKNNSNNNNKNSNPNNATRQQRNSGSNSKASTANHERYNLSVNDSAVNDITNKSSPTSNSAYGNGKKQQQWSGPKKQNLNHLLNFTYESQRDNENYYEYERQGRQFWSTKLAKNSYFSKEQFLQANCQFLVKSGSGNDYSVHMSDPDRLVEWEKIEEVHIDSHSPISCPICLHEPTAGKMTKCGHVYCWSCLLHYLSLSDKPWRKCPICYESVYKCDLKSARVIKNSREYKVGDEIEMQLVCKPRDLKYSTVCVAASDIHQVVGTNNSILSYETFARLPAECATYLKLHSYSPKRIHEMVIQREREELNKQLEAEKDQPEVCFVNEALVLLDEREAKLIEEIGRGSEATKRRHHSSNRTAKVEASVEPVAANFAAVEKPSIRYVDAFDEEVATDVDNKSVTDTNPKEVVEESKQDLAPTTTQPPKEEEKHEEIKTPKSSSSSGSSQLEMAFFYQSADGQRIFISGFNNRCLLSEYTSLSHAPDRIRARIIASDSLFMSEDNRRHRYKYLAHLPLHSEFKIVELDLESASPSRILSDKTLEAFREEFADRRRSRERKIAREKRECDRLAAQAAERELAYVPHYYVQSAMTDVNRTRDTIVSGGYLNEFPEASSSPPLSSGASLLSENSSNMSTTASSSSASANSANSDPALVAQMSFAQKLKNTSTTNNTTAWPTLDQFSSTTVSTSTTTTLGGWVNMAKQQQAQMSMSGRAKRCQNAPAPWSDKAAAPASRTSISGDDGEPEREEKESMPAPSYKQSFFSAIDETLRLIDAKKETTEEDKLAADSATSTNATTTNKKKKKTKQLLFSTSLNRAF